MAIFSKMINPISSIVLVMASLSGISDAFWRMDCHSRTGLARIDPLVDAGEISDHAHAIHGGNNFAFNTGYNDLIESECTSCLVTQDKSAYWTPSLHFQYANGTTVVVPQEGGMLAYYLLYGENIKAFPKGFQLIAGNTRLRNFTGPVPDPPKSLWTADETTQFSLGQKAIGFNCLDYSKSPEASLYRHFMPDKGYIDANCKNGLRLELMFPSCWNGKDVDSADHKSHMAYPNLVMTGDCPSGFETRTPSLFYETIWWTPAFAGEEGQFVLSNGDPTGYGYHGDFITGWEVDFLQSAINTCTDPSGEITACPLFNIQTQAEAAQCELKMPEELKNDNCAGPAAGLCGNVPIQSGPQEASALKPGGTAAPTVASSQAYTAPAATTPLVPTLSYMTPTYAATDSYGGGISIAAVNAEGLASVSPPSTTPTTLSTSPPVTAATSVSSQQPPGSIVSTMIYTSAGVVYEIAIEEIDITVTAEATPAAKHRRHNRHHRRGSREHGLLGV
ncbi:hypothetical protein K432DRAFT_408752 [Lepidopterella palustris CBS 459.81]|uniref:DUF1996 domain-containing protein n=1 Tax=Lepidopterella palustris CBS 459.81 TaxID=1314670 RepID=A0A8E2JB11_9PEZI|nr:hypothetical protein K432DRAFT_408752 [Lepidopterella palustris CBS 459.81]